MPYTLVLAEAMQEYSSFRSLIDQAWRIHFCSTNKMWQKSQTTYLSSAAPLYKAHCHFTSTSMKDFPFVNPFSSGFEQKCIADMKDAKVETAWLGTEQQGICRAATKWRTNKKNKSQFDAENLSKAQRCFLSSIGDCPSVGRCARGTLQVRRRKNKVNTGNKLGTSPWWVGAPHASYHVPCQRHSLSQAPART